MNVERTDDAPPQCDTCVNTALFKIDGVSEDGVFTACYCGECACLALLTARYEQEETRRAWKRIHGAHLGLLFLSIFNLILAVANIINIYV